MVWVRLDDHFDQHPKIAAIGPLGVALWVTGLAYCNRNLTDGFIPWTVAHSLLSWTFLEPVDTHGRRAIVSLAVTGGGELVGTEEEVDSAYVIDLLCSAGLWDEVGGGFRVHDYSDFQPTKADVEADRAQKQAAGQAGGRASAQARAEARAQAVATAGAQAKSKPVPVPVPVPIPLSSAIAPESGRARKETKPLTGEQRAKLLQDFADLGAVGERIEEALAHDGARKWADQYLYVRGWLRRDREKGTTNGRANQHRGPAGKGAGTATREQIIASWSD